MNYILIAIAIFITLLLLFTIYKVSQQQREVNEDEAVSVVPVYNWWYPNSWWGYWRDYWWYPRYGGGSSWRPHYNGGWRHNPHGGGHRGGHRGGRR